MQLHEIPRSVFRPEPPPLWFVTNGETTVGPVLTNLLMRGVQYGRIPDYCHVRAHRGSWRKLDSVREIAALKRDVEPVHTIPGYDPLSGMGRLLDRIRDEDELCEYVTRLSLIITGAEAAMFHYLGRSRQSLTTRCVLGPMSDAQLGRVLPEQDLVLGAARGGRAVLGPPYGATEDALAIRFASSEGGVGGAAMIPFFMGGTLTAMLEFSRPGRAFRRADLQSAERIVQRALRRRLN